VYTIECILDVLQNLYFVQYLALPYIMQTPGLLVLHDLGIKSCFFTSSLQTILSTALGDLAAMLQPEEDKPTLLYVIDTSESPLTLPSAKPDITLSRRLHVRME
jgi:hypothetical protein